MQFALWRIINEVQAFLLESVTEGHRIRYVTLLRTACWTILNLTGTPASPVRFARQPVSFSLWVK